MVVHMMVNTHKNTHTNTHTHTLTHAHTHSRVNVASIRSKMMDKFTSSKWQPNKKEKKIYIYIFQKHDDTQIHIHTHTLIHTTRAYNLLVAGQSFYFHLYSEVKLFTDSTYQVPTSNKHQTTSPASHRYQSIATSPPHFPSSPPCQAISPRQLQIWQTDRLLLLLPTYGSLRLSCIAVSGDGHMHFSQSLKCLIQNGSVTPREQNPH